MRLPGFIQLGAHKIVIVRKELNKEEAYGLFDSEALTITLDATLTGSLLWETFFHEIIEALNYFADADLEHKTIQVFGLLLHQVIASIATE
tara:strand:+ start:1670 stop:1942 length:273 start_codon:yes stop_codon:yes gene_type:complete